MADLVGEVNANRRQLKYEQISFSVSELVNMYGSTPPEVIIAPEYQRLFRWSRDQQTRFIETLLLEIPVTPLFFFETEKGPWELLDGLQRYSTMLKFVNADDLPDAHRGISNNRNDYHDDNLHDIKVPLQLLGGEYLTGMAGLTYARLPSALQLNIKRARIQAYVLKRETHATYKYEVFKRLNTGGADLEPQEVRNCSVRIIGDKFADFIQRLAKNADFRGAVALDQESARNAYADELVLRFFALKNWSAAYQHDLRAFLDSYIEEVAKEKVAFDYEMEERVFDETWRLIHDAIPGGEAFRGRDANEKARGPFSPTLFELVSLAVALNIPAASSLPRDRLQQDIFALSKRAREAGVTGQGSNSTKKTIARVNLANGAW